MSVALVACGGGSSSTNTRAPLTPERSDAGNDGRLEPNRPVDRGPETRSLVTVYFDYDEAALRPDAKESLRQNAEYLRSSRDVRVELQGNCDERGTEEYNLALGKRRAESAKQYLADLGISSSRMTTISFGEENPAVQGRSESAWAKNRRVDFVAR